MRVSLKDSFKTILYLSFSGVLFMLTLLTFFGGNFVLLPAIFGLNTDAMYMILTMAFVVVNAITATLAACFVKSISKFF